MNHDLGNIGDFGRDTQSMAGPLQAKLQAAQAAGFAQIMVCAQDLMEHAQGCDAAIAMVRASGLRVTAFAGLCDYEGLSGLAHAYKLDVAKSMLELCQALDCRMLLLGSSRLQPSNPQAESLLRDLRKLALLAVPLNIRVAYAALSDGASVRDFMQAGELIDQADMPNLGLAIGSFHLLANRNELEDLELLDPGKIFLVQLADFLWPSLDTPQQRLDNSRRLRVFPGEGAHSDELARLVTLLHGMGYRGDYSFDVANADYRQMPLATVAQRAWRAAQWLGEDVLRRSVPLPNQIRLKR